MQRKQEEKQQPITWSQKPSNNECFYLVFQNKYLNILKSGFIYWRCRMTRDKKSCFLKNLSKWSKFKFKTRTNVCPWAACWDISLLCSHTSFWYSFQKTRLNIFLIVILIYVLLFRYSYWLKHHFFCSAPLFKTSTNRIHLKNKRPRTQVQPKFSFVSEKATGLRRCVTFFQIRAKRILRRTEPAIHKLIHHHKTSQIKQDLGKTILKTQ